MTDRAALIAITHGVAPARGALTATERGIWDEAQDCVIAIAQAQLRQAAPPESRDTPPRQQQTFEEWWETYDPTPIRKEAMHDAWDAAIAAVAAGGAAGATTATQET